MSLTGLPLLILFYGDLLDCFMLLFSCKNTFFLCVFFFLIVKQNSHYVFMKCFHKGQISQMGIFRVVME